MEGVSKKMIESGDSGIALSPKRFAARLGPNVFSKRPWLLVFLFYAVFANLPFWASIRLLGLLPLGWVCIEYAGVGILALMIPRAIASLFLLMMITADILSAVSKTYYLSPTECLVNSRYLGTFSRMRLLAVASVMAVTLVTSALTFYVPTRKMRLRHRLIAAGFLLIFATLVPVVDYAAITRETGHLSNPFHGFRLSDVNRFSSFHALWAGRYPLVRLGRDETLFGKVPFHAIASLANSPSTPSASALAMRLGGIREGKSLANMSNLVIILVESWGISVDLSVRNSLMAPYSQASVISRYQVIQGTVPFYGSTVGGEARELCSSRIGLQIVNVSAGGLRSCLPDQLSLLGYHSVALHGMDGLMFSRSTWYRSIGFREQWFRDRFRQEGLPECEGAFVGTCDAAIAEVIGHRLETKMSSPDFLYWVTLNSHLPVPIPSGLEASVPCSFNLDLSTSPALCSWYQLVANLHESVAKLATAQLGRPTIFVVVGDHAPPFGNPKLRNQFSNNEVPFVLLIPK